MLPSFVSPLILAVQATMDILMKHSAETSDRPRLVAANEIQSHGLRVVLMRSQGSRLMKNRK